MRNKNIPNRPFMKSEEGFSPDFRLLVDDEEVKTMTEKEFIKEYS